MIFKQLFDPETWTYTYLIADTITREAVFIDPVNTHIDEYVDMLADMNLTLKFSLETHVHADHITAGGLLRQRLGTQTAVNQLCGAETADIQMQDGGIFEFANDEQITVIATPGHTPGSSSFLWRDHVFTGDSLLIGGCGRTDFQGGNPGSQYDSITTRLFTLPDDTLVYPGHDYKGYRVSSIIQERTLNPRLAGKTRDEFIEIMQNLNLPKPKLIDEAVPANLYCGLEDEHHDAVVQTEMATPRRIQTVSTPTLVAEAKQQITEIDVFTAKEQIKVGNVLLVDVREESEFSAGHIDRALSLPRGVLEFKINNLQEFSDKNSPILLYCGGGGRSALAALSMQCLGYTQIMSLAGGYKAWKESEPR